MKKIKRAIFLDRDGVINRVIIRGNKISSPWKLEEFEFLPGVKDVLKKLREAGFLNIVVTNQPDVKRGNLKVEELEKMNQILKENLPIEEIKICPHDDSDNCSCRKPKPGLLIEAAKKYGIDLKNSFLIGDGWKDVEAGKAVGCKVILLKTDYNQEAQKNCDFVVKNLEEAYKIIKKTIQEI
jgi:D-glycero-D-manno-heptose 1,7-bisphosphate phosphatase